MPLISRGKIAPRLAAQAVLQAAVQPIALRSSVQRQKEFALFAAHVVKQGDPSSSNIPRKLEEELRPPRRQRDVIDGILWRDAMDDATQPSVLVYVFNRSAYPVEHRCWV